MTELLKTLPINSVVQGGALEVLKQWPDNSVHCVVTSPPYWSLRDYGCEGQLGLEKTPEEYIEKIVVICEEIRRVLRKDGTLWLNLGDCYVGGGRGPDTKSGLQGSRHNQGESRKARAILPRAVGKLKRKNMLGMPWRVAFALQDAGWILRMDIIWNKPNVMPSSASDRPTCAHELVFLLSKSERYFYDKEGFQEACSPSTHQRISQDLANQIGSSRANGGAKSNGPMKAVVSPKAMLAIHGTKNNPSFEQSCSMPVASRNLRSVWTIPTRGYRGDHFATFPPELVDRCIRLGCPIHCCSKCGRPFRRDLKVSYVNPGNRMTNGPRSEERKHTEFGTAGYEKRLERVTETLGFKPQCKCGAESVPGVVADCFMGSGTTAEVAAKLGRRWTGSELSPEYFHLQRERLGLFAFLGGGGVNETNGYGLLNRWLRAKRLCEGEMPSLLSARLSA